MVFSKSFNKGYHWRSYIDPGNIIFGDIDSIVVISLDISIEVINKTYERVHGENKVREAILGGMGTAEVLGGFI